MYNNTNKQSYYDKDLKDINFLMKNEVEYQNLVKEFNKSKNPSIQRELQRKFTILCQGWDRVKLNNK